jgi:hypothetical protein
MVPGYFHNFFWRDRGGTELPNNNPRGQVGQLSGNLSA